MNGCKFKASRAKNSSFRFSKSLLGYLFSIKQMTLAEARPYDKDLF